jgi:hypothetical protein
MGVRGASRCSAQKNIGLLRVGQLKLPNGRLRPVVNGSAERSPGPRVILRPKEYQYTTQSSRAEGTHNTIAKNRTPPRPAVILRPKEYQYTTQSSRAEGTHNTIAKNRTPPTPCCHPEAQRISIHSTIVKGRRNTQHNRHGPKDSSALGFSVWLTVALSLRIKKKKSLWILRNSEAVRL